jgi:uncharacterized membrane protein
MEHPARIKLDVKSMLEEWKFGIKRATIMQGSLAIISFLLASISYVITNHLLWVIGGIVIIMNWPFTLLVIMPINKVLSSTNTDYANEKTKSLIKRWNRLHTVRTILGFAATVVFAFGLYLSPH